jgi:hypothetical protein
LVEQGYLDQWKKELDEKPDLLIDTECFSSTAYLKDLAKILSALKDASNNIRVIVPTPLHNALKDLSDGRASTEIAKIFHAWLMDQFPEEEQVQEMVSGLADDRGYKDRLRKFLSSFSPVSAEDVIRKNRKLKDEFIKFSKDKQIRQKLHSNVSKILAETFAIGSKLIAKIISFGRGFINICKRVGR